VEGRVFALAWLDGQPVGCGAIVPVDPITTEFRRVYVIADYRRQGIAEKLIRWLEERARAGGFRSIRLATGVKQPEAIPRANHIQPKTSVKAFRADGQYNV
jgi:putative acetyltransferase